MSRRTLVRCITAGAFAVSAGLALPAVSSAAPAGIDGESSASSLAACKTGVGPNNQTTFNTKQQLSGSACAVGSTWTVSGKVYFTPLPGFNASHVTGCAAHIRLTHIGGSSSERSIDCTAQAKRGTAFQSGTATFTGIGRGSYKLSGWVNIQTGVHYEGSGAASSWSFNLP